MLGLVRMERARKGSRWWLDSRVLPCVLVVAMTLTFPPCKGLEDKEQREMSGQRHRFHWANVNFTYIDVDTNKPVNETAEGKFGVDSVVESRTGLVVHIHDIDNKSLGCKEYTNRIPQVPWVALIERGGCTFTQKIKMATEKYNATAVVIYNYEEGYKVMTHEVESQVSIFILQRTGKELAKLADMGVKVELTITPGRKDTAQGSGQPNSISKTSVLFVSISFIVLMIISLAWLVFYYIQRFRYAHAKERLARRLASAAKKAIAKIPQKTVKNGDKELDSEFDQCAVCIEGYKPHDIIRTLPCKHVFHKSCVDPWLLDQRSCPMCKLDILRAYGMQVMGSQESFHQDPETGPLPQPVDDGEPSSTGDDQTLPDTEVKVLLLPHTCLHFPPDHDSTVPVPTPGPSSQSERISLVHPDQLVCLQASETQALMGCQEEEEEMEQLRPQRGVNDKEEAGMTTPLVVRLPEEKRKLSPEVGIVMENCSL